MKKYCSSCSCFSQIKAGDFCARFRVLMPPGKEAHKDCYDPIVKPPKTDIEKMQMPDFQRDIMHKCFEVPIKTQNELIKDAIEYMVGHRDWRKVIDRCSAEIYPGMTIFVMDKVKLIEFYPIEYSHESSTCEHGAKIEISYKYKKLY